MDCQFVGKVGGGGGGAGWGILRNGGNLVMGWMIFKGGIGTTLCTMSCLLIIKDSVKQVKK